MAFKKENAACRRENWWWFTGGFNSNCLYAEALNISYLKEITQSTFYLIEIQLSKDLVSAYSVPKTILGIEDTVPGIRG